MKEHECKAAFEQIDITPDFQVELIGCYRKDSKSQGILHPLMAQILVFQFEGKRHCLITIDSLGLTESLSNKLRFFVSLEAGTDVSSVMICYSHSHSAPNCMSKVNGEKYFDLLCGKIKESTKDAINKLRPCKAGWAMTDTGIAENRREGCAIVDKRLGALKIVDADTGCAMAVVLRISAHANILMENNNKISSDYFHFTRQKLHEYFSCPAMLIQGAAGDLKPKGVDKIYGGGITDLHRISEIILKSVKQLRFDMENLTNINMYTRKMTYYSSVPVKEEAEKIAKDAKRLCGIDGTNWIKECENLRESGEIMQETEGNACFFEINSGCFCGVAEEIFCEISIDATKLAGTKYFFLNGYTNGCTGYLPTAQEWEKGGYETLYSYLQYYKFHGHVMPFEKNTADRLVKYIVGEWKKH